MKMKQYVTGRETFKKCSEMIGKSDMTQQQRDKWRAKMKKQMNVFNVSKSIKDSDYPVRPLKDKLKSLENDPVIKVCLID